MIWCLVKWNPRDATGVYHPPSPERDNETFKSPTPITTTTTTVGKMMTWKRVGRTVAAVAVVIVVVGHERARIASHAPPSPSPLTAVTALGAHGAHERERRRPWWLAVRVASLGRRRVAGWPGVEDAGRPRYGSKTHTETARALRRLRHNGGRPTAATRRSYTEPAVW